MWIYFNGRMFAFQVKGVGSIPTIRTKSKVSVAADLNRQVNALVKSCRCTLGHSAKWRRII